LQKADLVLADLTVAGLLVPAQAKAFLQLAIKNAVLLPLITVQTMDTPKAEINKMRFTTRVLKPGTEGTALASGDRAKPTLSKTTLSTELFKAEVRLKDEVLEDSIERGSLKQSIMTMMAEKISADMEDVLINGDTTSADTTLAKLDGIIKQSVTNIVAGGSVSLAKPALKNAVKTMPTEYFRDRTKFEFLTSIDAESDYRDTLSERATSYGDDSLSREAPVFYRGIPLMGVPLFPENLSPGNKTVVLLFDPKNVVMGVQRQIRLKTDEDISAGETIIVVTVRWDVKYANEDAVVKVTDVTVS
jgi:hypothetical protein